MSNYIGKLLHALRHEPIGVVWKNAVSFLLNGPKAPKNGSTSIEVVEGDKSQDVKHYRLYFEKASYDGYFLKLKGWMVRKHTTKVSLLVNGEVIQEIRQQHVRPDVQAYLNIRDPNTPNGFSIDIRLIRPLDCVFEILVEDEASGIRDYLPLSPKTKSYRRQVLNGTPPSQRPTIILPVYNGWEYLEPLFDSILYLDHTDYHLVVIDDASTDQGVVTYLDMLAKRTPHMELIRNERNLGFVASVNVGFERAKELGGHVLLLNSDIELPNGYLDRILAPLIQDPWIATVTPFTNSGSICSFPNFNSDNDLVDDLDVRAIDAFFDEPMVGNQFSTIPTGVGFCMAINYYALLHIGGFDVKFGKGYGEENDFCVKASCLGFRNVLLHTMFVYHKHGGSFGDEKAELLKRNLGILHRRYPRYQTEVRAYIEHDTMRVFRKLLHLHIIAEGKAEYQLIIDHSLGGGANFFRHELTERIVEEKNENVLFYDYMNNSLSISVVGEELIHMQNVTIDDLALCKGFIPINTIHLNGIVYLEHEHLLIALIQQLNIGGALKVLFYYHDHYILCPSYKLWSNKNKYCGLPDISVCKSCLGNISHTMVVRGDIEEHRELMVQLLEYTTDMVFFSEDSLTHFKKVYPTYRGRVIIEPHQVDYLEHTNGVMPGSLRKKNVAILGNIDEPKGSQVVAELADVIRNEVSLYLLGSWYNSTRALPTRIKNLGRYKRDNLSATLDRHDIGTIFIPSQWPETYSYTAEEAYQSGRNIIFYNIGAPVERYANKKNVLILDLEDSIAAQAESIHSFLNSDS